MKSTIKKRFYFFNIDKGTGCKAVKEKKYNNLTKALNLNHQKEVYIASSLLRILKKIKMLILKGKKSVLHKKN